MDIYYHFIVSILVGFSQISRINSKIKIYDMCDYLVYYFLFYYFVTAEYSFPSHFYTGGKKALIYLTQRKFLLFLQLKRSFLCNKEKYICFKCLLLYFKGPLLESEDPVR